MRGRNKIFELVVFLAVWVCRGQGIIGTVAGNGTDASSGDGGPAISAALHPNGLALDSAGNLYIADAATSVVREYYEFERTSTAVVQGYLQPLVARYAKNLAQKLRDWGYERDIAIMQSNGGVAPLLRRAG